MRANPFLVLSDYRVFSASFILLRYGRVKMKTRGIWRLVLKFRNKDEKSGQFIGDDSMATHSVFCSAKTRCLAWVMQLVKDHKANESFWSVERVPRNRHFGRMAESLTNGSLNNPCSWYIDARPQLDLARLFANEFLTCRKSNPATPFAERLACDNYAPSRRTRLKAQINSARPG